MDMFLKNKMRSQFEGIFPDYAEKFNSAKTQQEVLEIHDQFLFFHRNKLREELQKLKDTSADATSNDDVDQTIPVTLEPETFRNLTNARGNDIHVQVQFILDGLERLSKMGDTANPKLVTAQIIGFGSLAVGLLAGAATFTYLLNAAIITEAVTISAALAGVIAVGVSAVVTAAAILIGLILVPIIYFMVKPAVCVIFLINELDSEITFLEDHNIHGKPTLLTNKIGRSIDFGDGDIYTNGGLFSTSKRDNALYGTQYGFTMTYKDKFRLTFATECPLTGDNNCYCSLDDTAHSAAAKTTDINRQYYETSKDGIKLSIRCNSSSGEVAWYVARAFKG